MSNKKNYYFEEGIENLHLTYNLNNISSKELDGEDRNLEWLKKALERDSKSNSPDKNILVRQEPSQSLEEVLAPLDEVFLPDELKDAIVSRVSIPQLLDGVEPGFPGVILYGPPGTGKTVLLKAICETYQRAGAYAKEVSVAQLNTALVGEFAKNLEREIQVALTEAKRTGKPSFIAFDEASILTQRPSEGAFSVSKHYQEVMDLLKKYIGNERNLVVAITTNELPEHFEAALVREGRLTPFLISYPNEEQRTRMWDYFTRKYVVIKLDPEQARELAKSTEAKQGAFIEEFCRNYLGYVRASLVKEKGCRTLVEALRKKVKVDDRDVKKAVAYDRLFNDVRSILGEPKEESEKVIGFKK